MPACVTSDIPLQLPYSVRFLFFVEYHDDSVFSTAAAAPPPPPNTNDDIKQYPSQGGITVEGDDLEQLNGESVRSDSLSVC